MVSVKIPVIFSVFPSAKQGIRNKLKRSYLRKQFTLITPKVKFLLRYQFHSAVHKNYIISVSHTPQSAALAGPYYLWISLSASLRGAVWWQRTVNSKYQRPLDRICTLPPWIRLRLWFIVVTSFYFHVIGSGWSHCFVKPASSFPRVALVAFRLVKDW